MQDQQALYSTLIPIVIIAIVMAFRFRSLGKSKPLRLERLWIVPAIYLALAAVMFAQMTPHDLGWLWAGLCLAAGAALGWQRGRAMRITVNPETHALNQSSSPFALLLILGLVAVRTGLRTAASVESEAWHLDAILITDCLVAFALGLLSVSRLEMYLRGKRLLGQAKATRAQ
jgi:hypothetical protein